MASKVFGIDFGTDTLKIYRKGVGIIYDQKTVLASKNKNTVIAIGNEAFDMDGKVPDYISIDYPLKNGVIANVDKMLALLNCVFMDLSKELGKFRGAKFFVAIPADITDVEKKAFYDLVDNTYVKPRKIRLIDKPIADAYGAGININDSQGALIVNIGADTTEISVLSLGGIVLTRLVSLGGKKLDESISTAIRRKYNLLIGNKTAEMCKKKVSSLNEIEKSVKVYGRDVVSGLPKERTVTTEMIRSALIEQLEQIVDNIRMILERTPPEISSDIYENGIYITGGTAKIIGISDFMEDCLRLKVHVTKDPEDSVISGLAEIMENPDFESEIQLIK
jgi:rod shape-determining protein MreB